MGFPHEIPELAFDTIRFNREVEAWDRNAYPFTPFHGTPLRAECEKLGFLKDEDIVQSVVIGGSVLNMPQFPQSRVQSIVKTFNMYVRFPDSRWKEIRQAEEDTPEGLRIYNELKKEFMDRYWKDEGDDFEAAALEQLPQPMSS